MHKHFALDPEYLNLNNGSSAQLHFTMATDKDYTGSYGSPPRTVLEYANKIAEWIESNPNLVLRRQYQALLIEVRANLAKLIGAETDECVMVMNASLGVDIVLRNMEWNKEDIIVICQYLIG